MHALSIPQSINKAVSLLSMAYDLHIRDIDQLMNKFQSCLRSALSTLEATQKEQYINFPALLIGIIEHDKSQEVYEQRTKFKSPDPVIKNGDFKISHDFNLINFVDKSMQHITFSEVHDSNEHDRRIAGDELPNPQELRTQLHYSNSTEYKKFINDTADNISNSEQNSGAHSKHWNWNDMKTVIELAGTLE